MLWSALVALTSVASLTSAPASEFGTAADSVDACALFTRDEVAKLSGDAVQKPRVSTRQAFNVTTSSCWYSTRTDTWAVKIIAERGRTPEGLRDMLKTLTAAPSKPAGQSFQRISGIGEEAYWGQVSPTNGMLHMVVGGTDFLTVQTWGDAPGAGTLPKTKEIAATVLSRYKERYTR